MVSPKLFFLPILLTYMSSSAKGFAGCINEVGSLTVEIHGIMGSHNLQGWGRLSAVAK